MGGFKWWSNHLECGFEMIKMGASENRRSLLPIIYGTSMKEIMVNHWMLGYHMFEPQMPRRLGEATKWGVFCCQTNAKAHSGEKNGTWLQVQVFPAGCLYVVSQLLDTYLSTKNFASRGCELTSPKRHCSPSVRNSLHTSPQTLAQASIRNDFENRGLQNRCNSILYLPVLPPFKWPGLEKPIFCGTLEEKSPESAFRACSHLWAKLLFKAASICCHLCGIFPKLDAFPHHQKGHLGSTSTIFKHTHIIQRSDTKYYKVTKCPEWYSQSILLAETKIWQTRGVQDSRTLQKALGLRFSALLQSPDLLEQPIISSSDCGQKLLLRSWWIRVWSNWPTAILDGLNGYISRVRLIMMNE